MSGDEVRDLIAVIQEGGMWGQIKEMLCVQSQRCFQVFPDFSEQGEASGEPSGIGGHQCVMNLVLGAAAGRNDYSSRRR